MPFILVCKERGRNPKPIAYTWSHDKLRTGEPHLYNLCSHGSMRQTFRASLGCDVLEVFLPVGDTDLEDSINLLSQRLDGRSEAGIVGLDTPRLHSSSPFSPKFQDPKTCVFCEIDPTPTLSSELSETLCIVLFGLSVPCTDILFWLHKIWNCLLSEDLYKPHHRGQFKGKQIKGQMLFLMSGPHN